jgi:murein DD-endopeptidase MepM/ murein hydrolase activator NlpD
MLMPVHSLIGVLWGSIRHMRAHVQGLRASSALAAVMLLGCASGGKMAWPFPPATALPQEVAERGAGGALQSDELEPQALSLPPERQPRQADRVGEASATSREAPGVIAFAWPVAALGINSLFGERIDPIDGVRRFHAGVDLDASYGTLVHATADGTVVFASRHLGHGRQVVVEHAGGFRSVYSHLSQLFVDAGAFVRSGQTLGRLGNSGRSTGPHLHFEIHRFGEPVDPVTLLGKSLPLEATSSSR